MKKLVQLIKKNYFLLIFLLVVFFVSLVSLYKMRVVKPTYIYTKIKVGQGLWWAQTSKPTRWFVDSIKKGEKEYDASNNIIAEILSVNYYPIFLSSELDQKTTFSKFSDQYNIYLNLRLKVSPNKTGKYYFKRQAIGIGSPIEFEFSKLQLSGTIISIDDNLQPDKLIEKNITLVKSPYSLSEYESIAVGSCYFDGQDNVFEIRQKQIVGDSIYIEALIKFKPNDNYFVFGEEEVVIANKIVNFLTNKTVLYNYRIDKIE